jgi:hypothetical protein
VAADFFTIEVWTCRGLRRFVVLFFMDLSTRTVQIGGIAGAPNGLWMSQVGRNRCRLVALCQLGKASFSDSAFCHRHSPATGLDPSVFRLVLR